MPKTPADYSNVPIDEEMSRPTPREVRVADLAEKAKDVMPKRYDITSKNPMAARIIHDVNRVAVVIQPGETKKGVLLRPDLAEYLGKGDLTLTAA